MSRADIWKPVLGLLAITVLVCAGVEAQGPDDGGGRGRRGQRGRRPGGFDATMLLRIDEVRKELELSEEQIDRLDEVTSKLNALRRERPRGERHNDRDLSDEERDELRTKARETAAEEARKAKSAVAEVLSSAQMKRLEEIGFQVQGARALTIKEVAEKVGLSDEEMRSVEKALKDGQDAMREKLFANRRPDGDFMTKLEAARKEVNDKALESLTDEQRSQFKALQGEKFELSMAALMRGRGAFGRGRDRGRPSGGRRGRPDDGDEEAPRRPE